jgi:hypothetical protein
VLRCVRADGSETWQKLAGNHVPFFALHDLTHFAVETVLGVRRGFFGLVAEGWDIEETTGKSARGPLPDEAKEVELIVGALDSERASGEIWPAEDFNRHLNVSWVLTDEDLARVRARRAELFAAWRAIEPGEMLELRHEY